MRIVRYTYCALCVLCAIRIVRYAYFPLSLIRSTIGGSLKTTEKLIIPSIYSLRSEKEVVIPTKITLIPSGKIIPTGQIPTLLRRALRDGKKVHTMYEFSGQCNRCVLCAIRTVRYAQRNELVLLFVFGFNRTSI